MLGWAHLAQIGGRPAFEELLTLKDEDQKVVICQNRGKVANWWTRKDLLECLQQWLTENPI